MDKSKIAIITTVASKELYIKTSRLFPKGLRRFIIDGSTGMHGLNSIFFMFKKLEKIDLKWLIMADEDVIFRNTEELFSLIEYMQDKNISCCGIRDGGEIAHRHFNPYAINTFFSVLDFQKINRYFSVRDILKNQYIEQSEFNDDLSQLKYDFDPQSLYEPYYCFYFWLRRRGLKMLFLESEMLMDGITNRVFSNNGTELLLHTWYARSFAKNEKHTHRISNLIEKHNIVGVDYIEPVVFKDSLFHVKILIKKVLKRIKNKL